MPLDVIHEDIAYVSGYAHVRSDDRKDTLDAFGHLAVYIDMGTVGCRNIDQEPFPVTVRFLFLFLDLTETVFPGGWPAGSVAGGASGSGCPVLSSAGISLPKTGISPTMISLRMSSSTSTFFFVMAVSV